MLCVIGKKEKKIVHCDKAQQEEHEYTQNESVVMSACEVVAVAVGGACLFSSPDTGIICLSVRSFGRKGEKLKGLLPCWSQKDKEWRQQPCWFGRSHQSRLICDYMRCV